MKKCRIYLKDARLFKKDGRLFIDSRFFEIMAETIMKAEKGWLQRYELSFRKFEG